MWSQVIVPLQVPGSLSSHLTSRFLMYPDWEIGNIFLLIFNMRITLFNQVISAQINFSGNKLSLCCLNIREYRIFIVLFMLSVYVFPSVLFSQLNEQVNFISDLPNPFSEIRYFSFSKVFAKINVKHLESRSLGILKAWVVTAVSNIL